jgi:small conductance mechanosensitive channel
MDFNTFYDKSLEWLFLHGPGILSGLIVLFTGWWLIKIFSRWIRSRLQKQKIEASIKTFFVSIISITLRILLFLAVMQIVGIQMTLFAALIGAFGVAAGLALSGTLQNFASGILILLLKPFRTGDNLIFQNLEGKVTDIQLFYTIVTTFDNKTVIVPNSKLSNEVIINLSCQGSRRLDIELKFSYDQSPEAVRKILHAAIDQHQDTIHATSRRIGVVAMEADGYKMIINLWLNVDGFYDQQFAIQELLVNEINKAGLKMKETD